MITIRNTAISTVIFGGALSFGSSEIMAQTIGLEYTTEWQTDFKNGYDWLNLLKVTAELPVCSSLTVQASTISTSETAEYPLVEDLLTYSNIQAGNIPLTFARLGFALTVGNADVFAGINNVNEDYFTSEQTAFFTNSSCGISPTISCNYDIANYPLAAWCVHYRQQAGPVAWQTSLYPGQGYSRILGHDNLFSLQLKRDGIFSISSIDYRKNGIYCILGTALHYGVCIGDEDAVQSEAPVSPDQKAWSVSPWLLSEIDLPNGIGLHLHASCATVKQGCKSYFSGGLTYSGKYVQPGVSAGHATFSSSHETDIEVTCRVPLTDKTFVQPALHMIHTGGEGLRCAALLRMQIEI